MQKRFVYSNFWKKFQIFSFDFQPISGKQMFVSDFFHNFHLTTMMKNQYLIPQILYYSITPHTPHSWMLSASLTITRVRVYVHLIHFQSQRHMWKCKIAIPSLFKQSTDMPGPAAKASVLRDPPSVLTRIKGDMPDHQRKGLLKKW